jgi:hypothetical protein
MDLVSCNFTLEQISIGMGIPERTLSRHFAQELATGKLRVNAEITAGIVAAAVKGDTTARILYAKALAGWHERTGPGRSLTKNARMASQWAGGDPPVSRPCSICLHPGRRRAEDLLSEGWSIRRTAFDIGVGTAALHRHWLRHVGNRDRGPAAGPVALEGETVDPVRAGVRDVASIPAVPRSVPPLYPLMPIHPAGGQLFCWCARCLGRRGHYSDELPI